MVFGERAGGHMINAMSRVADTEHVPLLDTVNLKINPPDSRRTKYEPQ